MFIFIITIIFLLLVVVVVADSSLILGTYEAGKEVVRIRRISPVLKVISSKQRPRKLLVSGSDGCEYEHSFLLSFFSFLSSSLSFIVATRSC